MQMKMWQMKQLFFKSNKSTIDLKEDDMIIKDSEQTMKSLATPVKQPSL